MTLPARSSYYLQKHLISELPLHERLVPSHPSEPLPKRLNCCRTLEERIFRVHFVCGDALAILILMCFIVFLWSVLSFLCGRDTLKRQQRVQIKIITKRNTLRK